MAGIFPDNLGAGGLLSLFGGQQQPQPAAMPDQSPSFLSKLGTYLGDNQNMLMGFGAGIAQGGIGKGLQLGATLGQLDTKSANIQNTYTAVRQALITQGKDPASAHVIATAAAQNPEILKTIGPALFETQPKLQETGTDPLTGQKTFGVWQPQAQTLSPVKVAEASGTASAAVPGGNSLQTFSDAMKSGVSGEDLYQHMPSSMAPTVKAMIEGRMSPPSTIAMKSPVTMALINAANAVDPTFDATTWAARSNMAKDLAKSTPASAGGQIQFARTAINHLTEVADAAKALGNYDTGIGPLNTAINTMRGLTSDQRAKIASLQDAAQHYGQEVTKFYAGSPGGEAERQRFLTALGEAKSPQELAAVIERERSLIPGRLSELENRINGTMGATASRYPVHSEESRKNLDKIDATVAEMRGVTPSAPAATSLPAPDAQGWMTLPGGVRIREKR